MKKEYNIAFSREHSSTSYITASIFHSNQALPYIFYIINGWATMDEKIVIED